MRLSAGARLVVATHNRGKFAEFAALCRPFGIDARFGGDLGLGVPAETAPEFAGNARLKAEAAARATGLPALADDSGLCVAALNGAPGVQTADWTEGPGGRDAALGMRRLHAALLKARAPEPWAARFVAVLAICDGDGACVFGEGHVAGLIVWPPRGTGGHGYDPVFQPECETRTFAEMPPDEKNGLSHRARAFAVLADQVFA
jgi:XTP/dITP diphosphohydrolase